MLIFGTCWVTGRCFKSGISVQAISSGSQGRAHERRIPRDVRRYFWVESKAEFGRIFPPENIAVGNQPEYQQVHFMSVDCCPKRIGYAQSLSRMSDELIGRDYWSPRTTVPIRGRGESEYCGFSGSDDSSGVDRFEQCYSLSMIRQLATKKKTGLVAGNSCQQGGEAFKWCGIETRTLHEHIWSLSIERQHRGLRTFIGDFGRGLGGFVHIASDDNQLIGEDRQQHSSNRRDERENDLQDFTSRQRIRFLELFVLAVALDYGGAIIAVVGLSGWFGWLGYQRRGWAYGLSLCCCGAFLSFLGQWSFAVNCWPWIVILRGSWFCGA